jgi:Tfp pilus assembly PilM family ATPase
LSNERRQQESALAKKLMKRARDAVVANKYRLADEFLQRIPPSASESVREPYDAIRERVWLAEQITAAPYADPTLLAIAARLVKLQPRDTSADEWHKKIKQRLARAEGRSSYPMVPWTKPAGNWRLGAPTEPITNVAKIHWEPSNSKVATWQQELRRHLVALGLALTGAGRGRYDFDLRPGPSSWLERLTPIRNLGRRPSAWGLDFGASGLTVVRLSIDKQGTVSVDSSGIIACDRGQPASQSPELQTCFRAAVARFVELHQPGDEPIVVGFPGTQSLGRFFVMPRLRQSKRFQTAVEVEVRNQIPIPIDDVVYAADRTPCQADDDVGPERDRVSVVAARRAHLEMRLGPFIDSGIGVGAIQSDCVALLNVLHHSFADALSQIGNDESLALVEIGDSATNVVIASQRGPCFRTVHHGMSAFNKQLVSRFGITFQQADQLRLSPATADVMHRVDETLLSAFEKLTRAVRHALDACAEATGTRVVRVYVAGGGCDQFGLLRTWASERTGNDGAAEPPAPAGRNALDDSSQYHKSTG